MDGSIVISLDLEDSAFQAKLSALRQTAGETAAKALGAMNAALGQTAQGFMRSATAAQTWSSQLTALAVGLTIRFLGRSFPALVLAMVLGLVLCYAFGSAWFLILYTKTKGAMALGTVLSTCVVPFLLPDALKILLAALLTRQLQGKIRTR